MRKKIQNTLQVICDDIDLTTVADLEFYVKQSPFNGCYIPTVVSTNEMVVVIPFEDAMKLRQGKAGLQFAFTYADGTPDASETLEVDVGDLFKEEGYDPNKNQ